ncbi:MAG: acriflavin resistance protein [Ignavibacteriales bacterium CG18_big_fil_WC_8_21_14_2_50_31_20]|nr:MAG: acriflavin resistance protein [Ignavibacteriales bacterium CG18_big_fil_WC_8_21_14_2_50_31_20]
MNLIKLSVERPVLTTVILMVFILFGGLAFNTLNLNNMPKVEIPYVTITTIYPGAGPKENETLITKKVEDAVSTISQIKRIESYNMDGVAITLIEFALSKDVDVANQEVKDKVDQILNDLPSDAKKPIIQKIDINAAPIMDLVLSGEKDSRELYHIASTRLKDRLSQINGVADVKLAGGQEREIRIALKNKVVYENFISLPQMLNILASQNIDLPSGTFKLANQEYSVRVKGKFQDVNELKNLEIPTAFGDKRLAQIANVEDSGKEIRKRAVYFDSETGITDSNAVRLSIIKSSDGNEVDVSDAVNAALPEILSSLPKGLSLKIVSDNSVFTRSSVDDTTSNISLGVILTSIILFLFLFNIRSTIIVALSMPASIISTFLLFQWFDMSLNVMSLMGISVSVGVLVSNSVVVIENIFRHKDMGNSPKDASIKGTTEVAIAVVAATLTNVVVFLPIANMSSMVGMFMKELALAAAFSTIFSLLFSFTLTPMLASLMIRKDGKVNRLAQKADAFYLTWDNFYRKILTKSLKNKFVSLIIIAFSFVLFIISVLYYGPKIGFDMMPQSDNGLLQVTVELPQEYNIYETGKVLKTMEDKIKKYPGMKSIVTELGKITDINTGTNVARMDINFVLADQREQKLDYYINEFVKELSVIPNARLITVDYKSFGGGGAPIQFFVMGQDLEVLNKLKNEIFTKIQDIPGLINLDQSSREGKPEITIIPNRKKLSESSISAQEIAITVRSALEGIVASKYLEDGEEYDITVTMNDASVDSPEKIGKISIPSRNGNVYRISQLADVKFTKSYSKILHRDKYVTIQFTGSPAPGIPLGNVTNEIENRMKGINFPEGYKIKWSGTAEMMKEMVTDMGFAFVLAMLLTYLLLAAILESFVQPVFILLTVPLAIIGVLASLYYTGIAFAITSLMAIIMLIGIVVNNAILMLDYTNQLVREQNLNVKDALIEACPTKLKPIIMSTLAIILGMLPLAIGIGSSGVEMRQPLGVVAIGGLIVSTVLTLFVVPAFYYIFEDRKNKSAKKI